MNIWMRTVLVIWKSGKYGTTILCAIRVKYSFQGKSLL